MNLDPSPFTTDPARMALLMIPGLAKMLQDNPDAPAPERAAWAAEIEARAEYALQTSPDS